MSEKFNGFSQDEIKQFSVQGTQKKVAPIVSGTKPLSQQFRGAHGEGIRRVTDKVTSKATRKKQQVDKTCQQVPSIKSGTIVTNDDTLEEINLDQSMSKSIEEALFFQPAKKPSEIDTLSGIHSEENAQEAIKNTMMCGHDMNLQDSSILHLTEKNGTSISSESESCIEFDNSTILSQSKHEHCPKENDNILNLDSPFKGISLKDFEMHRKLIEEQNKQKKEMLHKAIEQYSLKTAAEARKLEEIKTELSKLDNDLALDVAILRKQIDMACMHFANMEKQYMKIEAQFLKAKIDLHNAAEKKELLTEHLCTVIAHNEDRKAQKLSELMQKVGLTSVGELEPNEIHSKETSN